MSEGQWPTLGEIYFKRFSNTVGFRREMQYPIAVGRRMLNCIGIVGLIGFIVYYIWYKVPPIIADVLGI